MSSATPRRGVKPLFILGDSRLKFSYLSNTRDRRLQFKGDSRYTGSDNEDDDFNDFYNE